MFKTLIVMNPLYISAQSSGHLEVLEMDIKFVWIEQQRRHAFITTVIDTFPRDVLGRRTALSIKQSMVKELWSEIIENHLQPYDCLNRQITLEIRNDNDIRFIAASVQKFFKDNHICQVFTHPSAGKRPM